MKLFLSENVNAHINKVIDNEIKEIKKELKSNNNIGYEAQLRAIAIESKIKWLEEMRSKLLTVDDQKAKLSLNTEAIVGGFLVFPNMDMLVEDESIVKRIIKAYQMLCVENDRPLEKGDRISVYTTYQDKVYELECTVELIVTCDNNTKNINLYIEPIVQLGQGNILPGGKINP